MAVGGAEEHFAKKLANNDKKIRDRALKRLQAWIASRPSTGAGFSEVELLKIWKGLFYCFWMSDKPLIQEELAENISKLQHCFKNNESGFVFIITFFKTMHKEWHGIDRLRLDKFYLLVRMFIKENFEFLKKNSWDPSICSKLCDIYKDGPLHPTKENVPDGIKLHFCGVFLSELRNVTSEKVLSETILLLLEPFFILTAESKSHVVSQAVKDGILDKLLEIEEQRRLKKGNEVADDEDDDDINHKEKQTLQINIQAIADKLFTLGSDRRILGRNRKVLYQYAKKFKKAVPDETEKQEKGRKRKLDKDKENDELDMPVKKKKKQRNSKSHRITLSEGEVENEQEEKKNEKDETRREKKRKKDPLDDTALDVNVNEIQTKPKKKKEKSKEKSKKLDINGKTKDMSTNGKESTEQTSNGFKEDQMTNFMELSFQGETKDSEKIVEKTIRELRSHVSSTQHVDKTPAEKKKNAESNEMPFATFTKAKTPPAFFKKALSQTEPRRTKQTKLACPKSDPQSSKKKVRIHLHKNVAQTPSDYAKSVSSSPSIPFDANRSPEYGLLKTKSLTNSHPSTTGKKNTPSKRSKAVDFF